MLDHLESRGCRKIFLCGRHFCRLGLANLSERSYAFKNECSRRGLEYKILTNGNYEELVELIKSDLPDAIMFINDNVALKFKLLLKTLKLSKKILVTGFDGIDMKSGLETKGLITIKVDYAEMGKKAVDLTVENSLEDWSLPDVSRIRGKLILDN